MPLAVLYTTPQKVKGRFCVTVTYTEIGRPATSPVPKTATTIKGEMTKDAMTVGNIESKVITPGDPVDLCFTPVEPSNHTITIRLSNGDETTIIIKVEN